MNKIELHSKIYRFDNDDNLYFVSIILVDGEPIADFSYYATSLTELKDSTIQNGNYFILTCWCGVPDCAGIEQGIQVTHNQNTVKWTIAQPKPHRVFTFSADDYKTVITEGIEQIKLDLANLWFTETGEQNKLEIVPRWEDDKVLIELLNINL